MKRCVIHIGMPKTGTTSIQKSLNGFSDDEFVWFHDFKSRTNHSRTFFCIAGLNATRPRNVRRRLSGNTSDADIADAQSVQNFDNFAASLGERTLVMSGEGLLKMSTDGLREFRSYLSSRDFEDIRIAAYVRSPISHLTSIARAQMGGTLKNMSFESRRTGYRQSFEKFDNVFGRTSVDLWKFDPKTLLNHCVVQDFCHRIGLKAFPGTTVIRANESLSKEAVSLFYVYRHVMGEDATRFATARDRKFFMTRLARIGNGTFRLSPNVMKAYLANNRADIGWMELRLGESLDEELTDDQAGGVESEDDLLRIDPQTVAELQTAARQSPATGNVENLEEIARLVHALKSEPRRVSRRRRRAALRRQPREHRRRDRWRWWKFWQFLPMFTRTRRRRRQLSRTATVADNRQKQTTTAASPCDNKTKPA